MQAGKIPPEDVKFFSSVFLSPEEPLSAVEWANNQLIQQEYSRYEGNRTWKKALEYYADGNLEEAYKTLGFIMHLAEDMTVPEHTRDDTHLPGVLGKATADYGSPYEQYTEQFGRGSLHIANELKNMGLPLPAKSSIEEYLISLAEYSNKYFFSKDTINDPKYPLPKIIREEGDFGYGIDENNTEFPLVMRDIIRNENGESTTTYSILDREEYHPILSAYFSRLSRQAVLYGAAVINLFQKQAADAVVNKEFPTHLVKYDFSKLTLPFISLVGEGKKAVAAVQSFFGSLAYITENAIYLIIGTTKNLFSSDEIISQAGNFSAENQPVQIGEITNQESRPEVLGEAIAAIEEPSPAQSKPEAGAATAGPEPSPQPNLLDKLRSALPALVEQLELILKTAQSSESTAQSFAGTVSLATGGISLATGGTSMSLGNSSGGGGQSESSAGSSANSGQAPSTTSTSSPQTGSGQGGSAASSTENTAPTSTQANVNHLVISEVQISGADAGDEFIELYNPTAAETDLSSWSIQYLSGSATSTATAKKKNFEAGNKIGPKGFFLVTRGLSAEGDDGYRGEKPGDLSHRSFALFGQASGATIFLVDNQEVISGADDPNIVDRLAYGSGSGLLIESAPAPLPSAGQSIERKASQGSGCVSPEGNGEFLGNGCDTDSNQNDFEARQTPNPQNSESLPEPRQAPAINNLRLEYNPAPRINSPRINFSWDESADALGATSTNIYTISAINSSSGSAVFSATATLTYNFIIDEVGRQYDFRFAVSDRDGLERSATTSVFAPSFLDNFYFYRDPRGTATKYLVDLTTSSTRPFWDLADPSDNQNWKLIAMYLNHDAPKQSTLTTANYLTLEDSDFLRLVYRGCYGGLDTPNSSLLIPWNRRSCQQGGPLSFAFSWEKLEDRRFTLEARRNRGSGDFSENDYITLAFYDFGGGGGGEQRFSLAAVDKTKYYFQTSTPPQASPSTPANLSLNFDEFHSALNLTWTGSMDEDTLDNLITYEINYSTSSALEDSGWQSVGSNLSAAIPVVYNNAYIAGVRAADDFGNVSTPAILNWSFPENYTPLPSQLIHNEMIDYARGAGQTIFMTSTASISAVAMWASPVAGRYSSSDSYLAIYSDNNGTRGELLATSSIVSLYPREIVWPNVYAPKEVIYSLNTPIVLVGGNTYWLVPTIESFGKDNPNDTAIFGSNSNPYADGFWSANPGADAYFLLRRAEQ